MRQPILIALVIVSLAGAGLAQVVHAPYAYAQDAIDQHKADTFDIKMFTRPPGDKAYACFMRRYDAEHLGQHPKQKVAAMKLLVTAEIPEGEKRLGYSFRLGVKFQVLSTGESSGTEHVAEHEASVISPDSVLTGR